MKCLIQTQYKMWSCASLQDVSAFRLRYCVWQFKPPERNHSPAVDISLAETLCETASHISPTAHVTHDVINRLHVSASVQVCIPAVKKHTCMQLLTDYMSGGFQSSSTLEVRRWAPALNPTPHWCKEWKWTLASNFHSRFQKVGLN